MNCDLLFQDECSIIEMLEAKTRHNHKLHFKNLIWKNKTSCFKSARVNTFDICIIFLVKTTYQNLTHMSMFQLSWTSIWWCINDSLEKKYHPAIASTSLGAHCMHPKEKKRSHWSDPHMVWLHWGSKHQQIKSCNSIKAIFMLLRAPGQWKHIGAKLENPVVRA